MSANDLHVKRNSDKHGNPPKSRKGRRINTVAMGPWAMLTAMRRLQNGESLLGICLQFGIATNTLKRWQSRFGGDVAHVKASIDYASVLRAVASLLALSKQLARQLQKIEKGCTAEQAQAMLTETAQYIDLCLGDIQERIGSITGENGIWHEKRRKAAKIEPSQLPYKFSPGAKDDPWR